MSTSASSDDDDNDGDGGGSRAYQIEPSQPIQFTCMEYLQICIHTFHIIFIVSLTLAIHFSGESHYTQATQDMDHGKFLEDDHDRLG
jgi:hypothetical protein